MNNKMTAWRAYLHVISKILNPCGVADGLDFSNKQYVREVMEENFSSEDRVAIITASLFKIHELSGASDLMGLNDLQVRKLIEWMAYPQELNDGVTETPLSLLDESDISVARIILTYAVGGLDGEGPHILRKTAAQRERETLARFLNGEENPTQPSRIFSSQITGVSDTYLYGYRLPVDVIEVGWQFARRNQEGVVEFLDTRWLKTFPAWEFWEYAAAWYFWDMAQAMDVKVIPVAPIPDVKNDLVLRITQGNSRFPDVNAGIKELPRTVTAFAVQDQFCWTSHEIRLLLGNLQNGDQLVKEFDQLTADCEYGDGNDVAEWLVSHKDKLPEIFSFSRYDEVEHLGEGIETLTRAENWPHNTVTWNWRYYAIHPTTYNGKKTGNGFFAPNIKWAYTPPNQSIKKTRRGRVNE